MLTIIQGMAAGGASVYLQNRLREEASEQDTGCWLTAALQANHLLLLTAETLHFAGSHFSGFKILAQSIYMLTPLSLAISCIACIDRCQDRAFSSEQADRINRIYQIAIAVLSAAALVLGDPLFAIGALSIMAMDLFASKEDEELQELLVQFSKIGAIMAMVGYTIQIFRFTFVSPLPEFKKIAVTASTILMSTKLGVLDPLLHLMRPMTEDVPNEVHRNSQIENVKRRQVHRLRLKAAYSS